MSMLGSQADGLRKTADMAANLDDFERVSVPWMRNKLAPMLREAADTIEKLEPHSNQLEPSRWHELFGTPERAARTLHHNGTQICSECLIRDECVKTPEDSKCMILHYDALLEWLRGDA